MSEKREKLEQENAGESPLSPVDFPEADMEVKDVKIDEEIKLQRLLSEVQRKEAQSEDWNENIRAGKAGPRFIALTKDQARIHMYGPDAKPHWRRDAGDFFCIEDGSHENRTTFDFKEIKWEALDNKLLKRFKEETGQDPLLFIAQLLYRPAEKYNRLLQRNGIKIQEHHRLRITGQRNLSTAGVWMVDVGMVHIHDILTAVLEKNYEKYQSARASLESQYFHELIHTFNDKDEVENGTVEELTLLAEFLYDPLNNAERNEHVFSIFGRVIYEEAETRARGKWHEEYDTPYQKVTSRILLWELALRGKIQPPLSPSMQKKILMNLDAYYGQIPENERDDILHKYARMKRSELYEIGAELDSKLAA